MHGIEPHDRADGSCNDRAETMRDTRENPKQFEQVPNGQEPQGSGDEALHAAMLVLIGLGDQRVARTNGTPDQ